MRLINEYPELRDAYDNNVYMMNSKEPKRESQFTQEEFWEEFLKKNNQHQTIVFGGNNPLFLPGTTNETEYYDQIRGLKNFEIKNKGNQRLNTDVDFGLNLNENQNRSSKAFGYGTYKKQYESDALQNIADNCMTDRELLKTSNAQMKEKEQATKVIFKFNQNSMRVMESMNNKREAPTNEENLKEEL